MLKIWKRLLIPGVIFILFCIGFILCDTISDPDISGAIGSIALFILFPLFIITLIWAIVSGVLLSHRYRQYPHLTEMELKHTRTDALRKQVKEDKKSWNELPSSVKKRSRIFFFGGGVGAIAGLGMIFTGHMALIGVGTVLLIFGISFLMFASPHFYNNQVDIVKMIPVSRSVTIEKIFEDVRDMDTVMGSAALGHLATMKQKCLLFGPMPGQSTYLYAYLNEKGDVFYMGEAVANGFIKEIYEEPLIPPHAPDEASASLASIISYNANAEFLKYQLFDFFSEYLQRGTATEIPAIRPEGVYLFDEHFKLTGQSFCLTDTDSVPVYRIEATYPLKSFRIYENEQEIFYMTKELIHALPTYRFTRRQEFYGVLEKVITFTRDRFVIGTSDGEFILESLTAMLGHNFRVTLNGRLIGFIMDDLSFTFRNIVFDNSVITVYDEKYRDVMAAMAVMAVREIKRDEEASH